MTSRKHQIKAPFLVLKDVIERGMSVSASSTPPYFVKHNLIDSQQEVATSNAKRIKLQCNSPIIHGKNEQLLIQSRSSLQNIVKKDTKSLENNPSRYVFPFQDKRSFESAKMPTWTPQADAMLLFEDKELQVSEALDLAMREKITSLPSSAHNHQGGISRLSSPEQIQIEPAKPLLRKIQSLNSGTTNGFAFDHHYFPKVVGVKSISSRSPTPISTQNESRRFRSFPQASKLQPSLQELDPKKDPKDISIYETIISAASNTFISPAEKQYHLLFTFQQKDGQSDMFLVAKDRVLLVRRYDYKGESFLVHTDNKGKSTVMAKLPTVAQLTSQTNVSGAASSQRLPSFQREATNASLNASENPEHTFHQRFELHSSTKGPVTITPVETMFLRRNGATRKTTEPLPPNNGNNQRQDFDKIPRSLQGKGNSTLLQPNEVYSAHQTLYGNIRKPNSSLNESPRNNTLNIERRQLLQQQMIDRLRVEKGEQTQIKRSVVSPQRVLIGQQCLDPLTPMISKSTHQVGVNDKPQISTAERINAVFVPITAHTSLNGPSSQQLVLNQSLRHRYLTNGATRGVHIGQQYSTNTIPPQRGGCQSYVSKQTVNVDSNRRHDPGDGGWVSPEDESKIQYQRLLMENIAKQLPSSEESSPSTANVLGNRRPDMVNARQHFMASGTIANESHRRILQATAHAQPHPVQRLATNERYCTERTNNDSHLRIDFERQCPDQQQLVNQTAGQPNDFLISQPLSSTSFHSTNPDQDELDENDSSDAAKKILLLVDSWQRRLCANNDSPQVRGLLVRPPVSVVTTQTTAGVRNSSGQIAAPRSRAVQKPTSKYTSPVISQVSCGIIHRSTGGENVSPKQNATALVLDPEHSIYVDATYSVLDDDRRKSITGQQLSNKGVKISAVRWNQSGVAVSLPVSLDRGWLQESSPRKSNNTSTAQQHLSTGVTAGVSSSGVNTIPSQKQQTRPLSDNDAQFSYKNESQQPKQTPLFDEQCAAMNVLKEIIRRSNPSCMEYVEPESIQRNNRNAAQANSPEADEVVEIIASHPELTLETHQTTSPDNTGTDLFICSQKGSSKVTQPQSTPQTATPCDNDDDDVVEIIMQQPEGDSQFSIKPDWTGVKNSTAIVSRESFANETPTTITTTTRTDKDKRTEMVTLPPEQNFQYKEEKHDVIQLNGDDEKRSKGETKTKKDADAGALAPIHSLDQDFQSHTSVVFEHMVKDEEVVYSSQLRCIDCDPSTGGTNAETNGGNAPTMTEPSAKKNPVLYRTRGQSENDEKQRSLADLAEEYEREAALKTEQQRDELIKKIMNTRERITQEKIDWKKKYLRRLEIQLSKRLTKIVGGTERTSAEDEND